MLISLSELTNESKHALVKALNPEKKQYNKVLPIFDRLIKDNVDIHNEDLAAALELNLVDRRLPAAIGTDLPIERENKEN